MLGILALPCMWLRFPHSGYGRQIWAHPTEATLGPSPCLPIESGDMKFPSFSQGLPGSSFLPTKYPPFKRLCKQKGAHSPNKTVHPRVGGVTMIKTAPTFAGNDKQKALWVRWRRSDYGGSQVSIFSPRWRNGGPSGLGHDNNQENQAVVIEELFLPYLLFKQNVRSGRGEGRDQGKNKWTASQWEGI